MRELFSRWGEAKFSAPPSADFRLQPLSIRALNIGVSVKLTSSGDQLIATTSSSHGFEKFPGMLCMKATEEKSTPATESWHYRHANLFRCFDAAENGS